VSRRGYPASNGGRWRYWRPCWKSAEKRITLSGEINEQKLPTSLLESDGDVGLVGTKALAPSFYEFGGQMSYASLEH